MDLFPSSGEYGGGAQTPTLVGHLERAKLSRWTSPIQITLLVQWLRLAFSKRSNKVGVPPPSPEDGNRSRYRKCCCVVFSIPDDRQSPKPQKFRADYHFVFPVTASYCEKVWCWSIVRRIYWRNEKKGERRERMLDETFYKNNFINFTFTAYPSRHLIWIE
jgi:hypothetical protein